MNTPRSYSNESDRDDKMTKKNMMEMKVITYTNKVHLPFWWFNHDGAPSSLSMI